MMRLALVVFVSWAVSLVADSVQETKAFFDLLAKEIYLPVSAKLIPEGAQKKVAIDLSEPPPIGSSEKIKKTEAILDGHFRDLIAGYPEKTRELLEGAYFRGIGLVEKPGLMEEHGNFAAASITVEGEKVTYQILVDPAVPRAPLWFRLKLIHEVAVHLGQAHQRVAQVGAARYSIEQRSGAFELFTELTASLVEKRVIDAIPVDVALADIKLNIKNEKLRIDFLKEYKFRREAEFAVYPWLRRKLSYESRNTKPPLNVYDIKTFVNFYETKEMNSRSIINNN